MIAADPASRPVWVARLSAAHIPAPDLSADAGWREIDQSPLPLVTLDARCFRSHDGIAVIVSADAFSDGSTWLHVSASRQRYVPTYADLTRVKRVFVGRDREAVQKFADEREHVNIHPNTLHLWSRLDGPATPDFRMFDSIAGGKGI